MSADQPDPCTETMREAKRRQLAAREAQLREAAERHLERQAPVDEEAVHQAGDDWLRGEVQRLRERRRRLPGT
jgi:hypothetical protein